MHGKHPEANTKVLELDLNSLESVKACARKFNDDSDRLDSECNGAALLVRTTAFVKYSSAND